MDQKCLPSWRNPARYPTSPDAEAFVHASHLMGGVHHASHLMGGVHQRGGRRAAHRAAHRGAVGPERSGHSILKLTLLCRCAGPQEAAFCVLRAMRHRGCYGIGGRVLEHRVLYVKHLPSVHTATLYMHSGWRRDGRRATRHRQSSETHASQTAQTRRAGDTLRETCERD